MCTFTISLLTFPIFTMFIIMTTNAHIISKGKGKAIPLQAWTGPEGSRRLRLPDFKTVDTRRW